MMIFRILGILVLMGGLAVAQTPVKTTQTSVTIAVTNTFQTALAARASRAGCLIQNNGTNAMYAFFGSGSPTTAKSFKIAAGGTINCSAAADLIITDLIRITGTSGDVAAVSEQ